MAPETWRVPESTAAFESRAADGATIAVRRHGNRHGPRLVLSHGSGFSIDAYYPFWSCFTDRFDLFVHDIRNHGWNPVGHRRAHNVPSFVGDTERVLRDIDRHFGKKRTIGVFHSLSALTALHHADGGGGFSALVLFDPPICPPEGFPDDLQEVGRRLATLARRRRDRFETPRDYAGYLSGKKAFKRVSPVVLDLFARTTLRRTACGTAYELCCPREYEAQIAEYVFCWSMTVNLKNVTCPVKAIGADPTTPHSYMPGMNLTELLQIDYEFIPETTHLLQLEQPTTCAALALEFLERQGLASITGDTTA